MLSADCWLVRALSDCSSLANRNSSRARLPSNNVSRNSARLLRRSSWLLSELSLLASRPSKVRRLEVFTLLVLFTPDFWRP